MCKIIYKVILVSSSIGRAGAFAQGRGFDSHPTHSTDLLSCIEKCKWRFKNYF